VCEVESLAKDMYQWLVLCTRKRDVC